MRTSIKKYALSVVGDIYPEEVIKSFLKRSKYSKKKEFSDNIVNYLNLKKYIEAIEFQCYAPAPREIHRFWVANDITPKKMESFSLMNVCLLQHCLETTTDRQLSEYYRLRLGLNDGTAVSQRSRMAEMAHRAEGKLIVKFAENPEALPKPELRNFVIIAALLSDGDIYHDQSVLGDFLDLVDYIVD